MSSDRYGDLLSKFRVAMDDALRDDPGVVRVSFFCSFPDGSVVRHYQDMIIENISHWIHCYRFTHPDCVGISVKFVSLKPEWVADDER